MAAALLRRSRHTAARPSDIDRLPGRRWGTLASGTRKRRSNERRPMTDKVLVSGGSGYIAGFLIRQLVAEGWRVHTTIRNLAKEAEVRKLLKVDDSRLRFFAADLSHDAGWSEAMAGCSHVAHLASPVPGRAVKDPDELIGPARDGALRALRAAKAAGVRRFVMTSSVAAIAYGRGRGVHTFTEADWTPPDYPGATPYIRSKAIAERAARDWVAKEGAGVEFCTVNPSVVLGPVWSRDYSTSIAIVKKLLDGALRGCPDVGFGVVDVRDVADIHVRMLTAPGMAGERFIASGPFMKMIEIARILKATARRGRPQRPDTHRARPARAPRGPVRSVGEGRCRRARVGAQHGCKPCPRRARLGRASSRGKHRRYREEPDRAWHRQSVGEAAANKFSCGTQTRSRHGAVHVDPAACRQGERRPLIGPRQTVVGAECLPPRSRRGRCGRAGTRRISAAPAESSRELLRSNDHGTNQKRVITRNASPSANARYIGAWSPPMAQQSP